MKGRDRSFCRTQMHERRMEDKKNLPLMEVRNRLSIYSAIGIQVNTLISLTENQEL